MTSVTTASKSLPDRINAQFRRIIRWLTSPHVVLSLIMLVIMFYMVIIPLVPHDHDHHHGPGKRSAHDQRC